MTIPTRLYAFILLAFLAGVAQSAPSATSSSKQAGEPVSASDDQDDPLVPFTPRVAHSSSAGMDLERAISRLNVGATRRLRAAGRQAVPLLINEMLTLDLTLGKDVRRGQICHEILLQITEHELIEWPVSIDSADVQTNRRTVEYWHWAWSRCQDDDAAWWELLGYKPGPLLEAVTTVGFPREIEVEVMRMQSALLDARQRYETSCTPLLDEYHDLLREAEQDARRDLIKSLPSEWSKKDLAGRTTVVPVAGILRQLEEGVELVWPLGLRESFTDTLRSSRRDAEVNQRVMQVAGFKEEIEVSVVTGGTSQYALVPLPVTWGEARRICEENGGHLACLKSPDELDVASKLFHEGECRPMATLYLSEWDMCNWIGATDSHREGDWRWLDGTPVDEALWLSPFPTGNVPIDIRNRRQPDNDLGGEHVAGLVHYTGHKDLDPRPDSRWGMMDWAGGFPTRFICEWGPEPFTGPWVGDTLDLMSGRLTKYFRNLAANEVAIQKTIDRMDKTAARDRTRLLRRWAEERAKASSVLGGALEEFGASWTLSEMRLVMRLVWLLEDDGNFMAPAGLAASDLSASTATFLGRVYAVFATPVPHHEAQRRCEELGGTLAVLSSPGAAASLLAGDNQVVDLFSTDLESAFLRALLMDAGVERAWLGYRRYSGYAWKYPTVRNRWQGWPDQTIVKEPLILDELRQALFCLGVSGWGYGHSRGAIFEALPSGPQLIMHEALAGQTEFSTVFGSAPAQALKLRVNGALISGEDSPRLASLGAISHYAGEARLSVGAPCPETVNWIGPPFVGGEKLLFYTSPIATARSSVRLPYICVWE
jgi:hypothetical protein